MKPGHRFKPGQSGNPGGRPRAIVEVAKAAREYTIEALETLAAIMRNRDATASARVSACEILIERGWGKAPQMITLRRDQNMKELSDDELIAIAFGDAANDETETDSGPDDSAPPNGSGSSH
jgi:hypothetical protein